MSDILDVLLDELAGCPMHPDKLTVDATLDVLEERGIYNKPPGRNFWGHELWVHPIMVACERRLCPVCNSQVVLRLPCLMCDSRRHVLNADILPRKKQIVGPLFGTLRDNHTLKIGIVIEKQVFIYAVEHVETAWPMIALETGNKHPDMLPVEITRPITVTALFVADQNGSIITTKESCFSFDREAAFGFRLEPP